MGVRKILVDTTEEFCYNNYYVQISRAYLCVFFRRGVRGLKGTGNGGAVNGKKELL